MTTANTVRMFAFLARVFQNQQHDPLCGSCKALVNSVASVRQDLARTGAEQAKEIEDLPATFRSLFLEAQRMLDALVLPENTVGQKKAGNCMMPPGVCFVKSSLAIREKVSGQSG